MLKDPRTRTKKYENYSQLCIKLEAALGRIRNSIDNEVKSRKPSKTNLIELLNYIDEWEAACERSLKRTVALIKARLRQ